MLNRLQLFRSVGLFDNVSTPPTLALAPLTLIYAENGRGKTTLSAILRSLSTDTALPIMERHRLGSANSPCIVIDCDGSPSKFQNGAWNHSVPNMAIFDDTFVDENICSGLVIESEHRQRLHEFILGAQGVALNAALQQAVDDVETHNRALRAKADAIPAAERGGLAVDDFCALPARADIDDVIQEAERNLAASRDQQSIRTAGIFEPFLLPEIGTDAISTVLAEELADLEATAAKKVQVHLVGIGEGGEAWVAAGMERVAEHALEYCPFCAQNLSGSTIIDHYRAYFSEAYAGLKERVARKIQEFTFYGGGSPGDFDSPADFERAIRVAVERRQFWSRFTDIPEIALDTAAITQAWSAAQAVVLATLHAKQDRPLESLQLSRDATAAIQTYELRRREVELLSYSLQDANRAIAVVREQAAATLWLWSATLRCLERPRHAIPRL